MNAMGVIFLTFPAAVLTLVMCVVSKDFSIWKIAFPSLYTGIVLVCALFALRKEQKEKERQQVQQVMDGFKAMEKEVLKLQKNK